MKKFWKNDCEIDKGPRFCKKCGCELVSTNKKKKCANCQRVTGKKIKDNSLKVLGVSLGVLALGVLNKDDDSDDNTIV